MSLEKSVAVTGGLGFIGSHTVVSLIEDGYSPVIIDNLSNSRISVLDGIEKITGFRPPLIQVDLNNQTLLDRCFENHKPKSVIHFAAFKSVSESVENPLKYYRNNVGGLLSLLEVMKSKGISDLVFSSSCTVYGRPDVLPVTENSPLKPADSPYGSTKQVCETILRDNSSWCRTQCLRYFNPVGAHPSGEIGELPLGIPSNLVPYLTQTAAGEREKLTIYGNDYDTPDGTCIRDYIHVLDLAEAHISSLRRLEMNSTESPFETFNLGTGKGHTVLEVVQTFQKATGVKVPVEIGSRRPGDVPQIWANPTLSEKKLAWKAKRDLESMMKDAWNWQKRSSGSS